MSALWVPAVFCAMLWAGGPFGFSRQLLLRDCKDCRCLVKSTSVCCCCSDCLTLRGMLQASRLSKAPPFTAYLQQSIVCAAQSQTTCISPGLYLAMESLRQRKPIDRVVTRSYTAATAQTPQLTLSQPPPKRRKANHAPLAPRGLNHCTVADNRTAPIAAFQTSTSPDMAFETAARSVGPSGVPANTPANVPADPNILHCWTKESMAAAAAHLATQDSGEHAPLLDAHGLYLAYWPIPLLLKLKLNAALAPLIEQHGVPDRLLAKGFTNLFNSLARSILSQQLAVKAASVIQGRFMALCKVSYLSDSTNPALPCRERMCYMVHVQMVPWSTNLQL